MTEPLAIYLHDHRAGANFAINLLEGLRDQKEDRDLGAFAAVVLAEVKADRDTLQKIVDRIGESHTDLKEAAAWVAEKASRFKLGHETPLALGTFEALETLALGILGKLSLWHGLAVISRVDSRLRGEDYERLAARAQEQHDLVEKYRLRIAPTVFQPDSK